MGRKMECPGCGGYSSSVLGAVEQGEPCPFCGLSAGAILEIETIRQSKADAALIRKTAEAVMLASRQADEVDKARRFMQTVRSALKAYDDPPAEQEGQGREH